MASRRAPPSPGRRRRLGTPTEPLRYDPSPVVRLARHRQGLRAYLETIDAEPLFARVYLLEWAPVAAERDEAIRRFARRYGASFTRAGIDVPEPALFLLAAGVNELACAHGGVGW